MHHERYVLESIRNRCYAPITTEHLDVIFGASPVFSTDMYMNFPVRTQVSCREDITIDILRLILCQRHFHASNFSSWPVRLKEISGSFSSAETDNEYLFTVNRLSVWRARGFLT